MRMHLPARPLARPLALLLGLLLPSAARAQQPAGGALSPEERAIVRSVDTHAAEALALLERVVNINSGTLNLPGVRAVGDVFRGELDRLGFATRWEPGEAFGRAGHLVATRGTRGPRVLLIGHLDTVFEPSGGVRRFERVGADSARGPGVTDMKGGDVAIVLALRALADAGALDRLRIAVVMNGDEELPGEPLSAARRVLVGAADAADVAIGFEDGDGDPHHAIVARRGVTEWKLTVTGTPAHSSQLFRPEVGYGAVFEAARILDAFRARLAGEPNLTFNPGLLLGGTAAELDSAGARGTAAGKTNVVAKAAVVEGDLRTLSLEQLARVQAAMRAIVADHLPGTGAELVFGEGYPPLAPTDGNRELLQLLSGASRDLGFGEMQATDPARAGAADVSFTAGHAPRVLDALGVKGHFGHTDDEIGDLRTLPMQAKRAAVLLLRLTKERPAS